MTDRRAFLAGMAGVPALSGLLGAQPIEPLAPVAGEWDFTWLDDLNGTYKQVFDCGDLSDDPLRTVGNYLRGFKEVLGLGHPTVNAVLGIAFRAFPLNASDAIWAKYRIPEHWDIPRPPNTPAPASNIWAPRVAALKAQGAIFWQCNNALNGIVGMFASATGQPVEEVRKDVVAGLLPGVKLVPAHTMALNLVQRRGCTYEKL